MVSSQTDVKICNTALAYLGEDSIQAFDEDTELAASCALIYPQVLDTCLALHDWNFIKKKSQLALSADHTPKNIYTNAFILPPDMLVGPDAVYANGSSYASQDYSVFENYIYCDFETVIVDYKARVDEQYLPPIFVTFLVYALAADLAMPITEIRSRAEHYKFLAFGGAGDNMQGGAFGQAKFQDAQSQPAQSFFQNGDPFTGVR